MAQARTVYQQQRQAAVVLQAAWRGYAMRSLIQGAAAMAVLLQSSARVRA